MIDLYIVEHECKEKNKKKTSFHELCFLLVLGLQKLTADVNGALTMGIPF